MSRITRWSTLGAIVVAACWVIGPVALAEQEAAAVSASQQEGGGPSAATLFGFSGGAVRRAVGRVQDAPTQIGETVGFNTLPGSSITMNVRRLQFDSFVVSFSGECRLFGASSEDWVQLEVRRNGVRLEPNTPTGDTLAFCSTNSWNSNQATFITPRLSGGTSLGGTNHTFTVHWRLVDFSPLATLRGWLDDWTLLVTQYE